MRTAILLAILTCVGAFAGAQTSNTETAEYRPDASIRAYFLGAWKLVSTEDVYPDGHKIPFPYLGPNGAGFIMYTPDGHMCAQLMNPGRARWADDNAATATEAEGALAGFVSYCGAFEVRESDHTMIHRPQTAWSPNWVGTEQLRPYHLVSQDRFFFRGTAMRKQKDGTQVGVAWTITWERMK